MQCTNNHYIAKATFCEIARPDWLRCGPEYCYLGPLQYAFARTDNVETTNKQKLVRKKEQYKLEIRYSQQLAKRG